MLLLNNSLLREVMSWLFTIYIVSIYLFSYKQDLNQISNGIFALFSFVTLLIIFKRKHFKTNSSFIILFAFVLYSYLSIFWSVNETAALTMSNSVFLMSILFIVIYQNNHYIHGPSQVIKSFLIAGLVMSGYTVYFYGFSNFFSSLISGNRLGTEINQANLLGMYSAYTVVICMYYAVFKKLKIFYFVLCLPFLVLVSSGSRTGLAICIIGLLILIFLKFGSKEIFKGVSISIIIAVFVYLILTLPIFEKISKRMDGLFSFFNKSGEVDSSTNIRIFMIEFGMEKFKANPLVGYGANSAQFLLDRVSSMQSYLHNNYIELLVNYGLIGFTLFYSLYFIFFIKAIPFIKSKNPEIILITVLLIMNLIADFGTVSYYRKTTFIVLILGYITINVNKSIIQKKDAKQILPLSKSFEI